MNRARDEQTDYYSFLADKHWIADPIQAVLMAGPRRALFATVMKHRPKEVLDVCCGTGGMARRFAAWGIAPTGIDLSRTMLGQAERKGRITHARLMDAGEMELRKEFDAAYINLAIHEMTPDLRERVWQKMIESVCEGGIVVVMDLNAPQMDTRRSRFRHGLFELDERNFLRTNPDHYANYREFLENGGLRGWMTRRVSQLNSEKYFFVGNIGVLSAIVREPVPSVR